MYNTDTKVVSSRLYKCRYQGPCRRHASLQNFDFRVKLHIFDFRVKLHFRTFVSLNLRLKGLLRGTSIESNKEEEQDGFSKWSFVVSD